MRPQFPSPLCCTLILLSGLLAGCASGKRMELLETRLRESEDRLITANHDLVQARDEIKTLNNQLVAVRSEAASKGRSVAAIPQPKGLAFASLLTGGIDEDGQPGDEAVRAIVHPVSEDGSPMKSAGQLEVELLDVSAPADRRVRGQWTYTGQELRDLWSSGLFSTGYQLELAPEDGASLPAGALLIARFTTPEGDQWEATRSLKLQPEAVVAGQPKSRAIQQVSGESKEPPLSDEELSRDLPSSLPVRDPPASQSIDRDPNPFSEFTRGRIDTSDSWNDVTIPTLR